MLDLVNYLLQNKIISKSAIKVYVKIKYKKNFFNEPILKKKQIEHKKYDGTIFGSKKLVTIHLYMRHLEC